MPRTRHGGARQRSTRHVVVDITESEDEVSELYESNDVSDEVVSKDLVRPSEVPCLTTADS